MSNETTVYPPPEVCAVGVIQPVLSPRERANRRWDGLKRQRDAGYPILSLRRWGYHSAKGTQTRIEWEDGATGEQRAEVFK